MRGSTLATARILAVAVSLAWILAGCAPLPAMSPEPAPTQAEAEAHLASVVAIVQSGDLSHLCDLGSGTCRGTLEGTDPKRVPATPPRVISSHVLAPTQNGAGGLILELCGRDGLGQVYDSDMLVFTAAGRLISTTPVYWLGIRIATSDTTDTGPRRTCAPST